MSDIVERLKRGIGSALGRTAQVNAYCNLCLEAADEVVRLRAQLEVAESGYIKAVRKAQFQTVTNEELNQLINEVSALKQDALRYRALTNNIQEFVDAVDGLLKDDKKSIDRAADALVKDMKK